MQIFRSSKQNILIIIRNVSKIWEVHGTSGLKSLRIRSDPNLGKFNEDAQSAVHVSTIGTHILGVLKMVLIWKCLYRLEETAEKTE